MNKYLLDTNICIFLLRGKYNVDLKIDNVGLNNCCISEITIAELKYGAELGKQKGLKQRIKDLNEFINNILRLYLSLAPMIFMLPKRLDYVWLEHL